MAQRRRGSYFKREPGDCAPVTVEVQRRVAFSDVDLMGIVWFGKYPAYFEEGSAEIGRKCGLSYRDFHAAGLRAPIAECHVDYHLPLHVDEIVTIRARLLWNESSKLNTEYELMNDGGELAASGYTVQMLTDSAGGLCLVSPPLLDRLRERWKKGELE